MPKNKKNIEIIPVCRNCRFFRNLEFILSASSGECHYNPPVEFKTIMNEGTEFETRWPYIWDDQEWCGKWELDTGKLKLEEDHGTQKD